MLLECSGGKHTSKRTRLLDERITKICTLLKSQDNYLQENTANPAHPAAIFCPILV